MRCSRNSLRAPLGSSLGDARESQSKAGTAIHARHEGATGSATQPPVYDSAFGSHGAGTDRMTLPSASSQVIRLDSEGATSVAKPFSTTSTSSTAPSAAVTLTRATGSGTIPVSWRRSDPEGSAWLVLIPSNATRSSSRHANPCPALPRVAMHAPRPPGTKNVMTLARDATSRAAPSSSSNRCTSRDGDIWIILAVSGGRASFACSGRARTPNDFCNVCDTSPTWPASVAVPGVSPAVRTTAVTAPLTPSSMSTALIAMPRRRRSGSRVRLQVCDVP